MALGDREHHLTRSHDALPARLVQPAQPPQPAQPKQQAQPAFICLHSPSLAFNRPAGLHPPSCSFIRLQQARRPSSAFIGLAGHHSLSSGFIRRACAHRRQPPVRWPAGLFRHGCPNHTHTKDLTEPCSTERAVPFRPMHALSCQHHIRLP